MRHAALVLGLFILPLAGCLDGDSVKDTDGLARGPAPDTEAPLPSEGILSSRDTEETYRLEIISSSNAACNGGCFEPTIVSTEAGIFVTDSNAHSPYRVGDTWSPMPSASIPEEMTGGDDLLVGDGKAGFHFVNLVQPSLTQGLLNLIGIQVHSSSDGTVWDHTQTWFPGEEDELIPIADREWLTVGPMGEMYLTFSQIPGGIMISKSDDGGITWPPFSFVTTSAERADIGQAGAPIPLPSGNVAVPLVTKIVLGDLALAVGSPSTGFELRTVSAMMEATGVPQAVQAGDTTHVVTLAKGQAFHAWSTDEGLTWSPLQSLGRTNTSPWIDTDGVSVYVMGIDGGGPWLARLPAAGGPSEETWELDSPAPADGGTDHAHFDIGPDGLPVLAWANGDKIFVGALVPEGG